MLHDTVMQAVGQSCAMHREWDEIEIPDRQDMHGASTPFEFDKIMLVSPSCCTTL